MSLPIGLARLLGKIESFRNPQFSNRELGAIAQGDMAKLVPWAVQEARKPLEKDMSRRSFFETIASMPGKAKKLEAIRTLPAYQKEFEASNAIVSKIALLDEDFAEDNPWAQPTDSEDWEIAQDAISELWDQHTRHEKQVIADPKYESLRDVLGSADRRTEYDDPFQHIVSPKRTAQARLSDRLFNNPYPRPYTLPDDAPNFEQLRNGYYAHREQHMPRVRAEEEALENAISQEFKAIDLEKVLESPEPLPPPPPPEPEPVPETPSFFSAYKKRFRLK